MNVENQILTDKYALYEGDCTSVLPSLPDASVDLSVYSPPFYGTGYQYSSSEYDYSNCATKDEFLTQYDFLIEQIARVTKPGRITAVHCTDIIEKGGGMWDFPHEIKKLHEKHGFVHRNTITVWKEPLKVRMRTMVKSLMHKLIVEDSTECFTAMPDQLLVFKKKGENKVSVEHPFGLSHYAGALPLLPDHLDNYGLPLSEFDLGSFASFGEAFYAYSWASFEHLKKKYANHKDPKTNKCSHIVWQRYASSVWDDVRIDEVLEYKEGRDEDDEKHIHPLQLDVIDRIVELYSNPGEVVLTPFAGVGSEVFSPVSMGRFGIGIELKGSYFKQMVKNLAGVEDRFKKTQLDMFAAMKLNALEGVM